MIQNLDHYVLAYIKNQTIWNPNCLIVNVQCTSTFVRPLAVCLLSTFLRLFGVVSQSDTAFAVLQLRFIQSNDMKKVGHVFHKGLNNYSWVFTSP